MAPAPGARRAWPLCAAAHLAIPTPECAMSLPRWPQLRRWLPLRCLLVALAGLLSLSVWWCGCGTRCTAPAAASAGAGPVAACPAATDALGTARHWRRSLHAHLAAIAPAGRLAEENRLLALETLSALRQHPGVDSLELPAWPTPAAGLALARPQRGQPAPQPAAAEFSPERTHRPARAAVWPGKPGPWPAFRMPPSSGCSVP